jgi:glyceraldehyde-3-phosphate dehydrogenase (ferredoxin)
MQGHLKVLFVDAGTGFYRVNRYEIGRFFGPVDLGLHLSGKHNSLNIGTGLLAGSIIPGSNRLIFTGFSPCWGGFFVSSMGGAGLVFDNLGMNLLSIVGKAPSPSVLYLNRHHGEEIQVEIHPVEIRSLWNQGRGGVYSLMDHMMALFGDRYVTDPRILATGPASAATDFGAICSVPIEKGKLTSVDTWAGRGGFGTKLFKDHGIAAIIYGGTVVDEDFRDRKVADQWFVNKYQMKLAAKDMEATTKYRFDPKFDTGGTLGVNYAGVGGGLLFFNYQSIYMDESERLLVHETFVKNHYLKQFNEETIKPKRQKTCGEPCVAVCKKLYGNFKKDYEPYQTMGPLAGIFDQRAAEALNHHADMYGFDAISAGGLLSWLMECVVGNEVTPKELGIEDTPRFSARGFDVVSDSMHNARIGIGLLDSIVEKRGLLDLEQGARKFAQRLSRLKGKRVLDAFVYTGFARKGWMVPNQYWTPGVLSPMAIMGKYYMYYGTDFYPPRELGRKAADRLKAELIMDNLGLCRFHRNWAEEMAPQILDELYGLKERFIESNRITACRINSRNASVFWESERSVDLVYTFLKRKQTLENSNDAELLRWIRLFETGKHEAALSFWYEMHKGIQETLTEF